MGAQEPSSFDISLADASSASLEVFSPAGKTTARARGCQSFPQTAAVWLSACRIRWKPSTRLAHHADRCAAIGLRRLFQGPSRSDAGSMPRLGARRARPRRRPAARRHAGRRDHGILDGSSTEYFPFPGKPVGHPTKLGGTAAGGRGRIAATLSRGAAPAATSSPTARPKPTRSSWCAPRGAGSAPDKYLIVAGAVTSAERISAVNAAGADAFTIGTAVFDGSYSPTKGSILSQLRDVLADCETRLTDAGRRHRHRHAEPEGGRRRRRPCAARRGERRLSAELSRSPAGPSRIRRCGCARCGRRSARALADSGLTPADIKGIARHRPARRLRARRRATGERSRPASSGWTAAPEPRSPVSTRS